MIYLVLIISLAMVSIAACLWVRLVRAAREARRALFGTRGRDPYIMALSAFVYCAIDTSLLRDVGQTGLAELELRFREHDDPYRNVMELLVFLGERARADSQPDLDSLVKATYQLSAALQYPLVALSPSLRVLIARLCQTTLAGVPVAKVQLVAPGDLVDTGTMIQLTYGARVSYPLGMIAYDAGGRVLSRAKVCCA
jgi:hypothetical protein